MPSCVLRVSGSTAKVREFLASSPVEPIQVLWKGEPRIAQGGSIVKVSGFNLVLSDAEGIEAQAVQAVRFILKHKDLALLIKSLGFSSSEIDFGLYDLASDSRPWPSYRIPSRLVQIAADLGCEIHLSFYGALADAS
ncbi:hypothetical protein [Rhodanobacter sp. MP1X3]|uniref:hypothetical protein n=1 Tax=Rhodanobacter sp. MP1X3 TaxID=2723086 RepID=UPI001610CF26|nr:hypothetical protein [Rhodanobacter sp. MP1X3]MBB6240808.1 hypothetical protein [Rhodanobacter sp. MP1X3]